MLVTPILENETINQNMICIVYYKPPGEATDMNITGMQKTGITDRAERLRLTLF